MTISIDPARPHQTRRVTLGLLGAGLALLGINSAPG
jgi:hypothetical protein